jgi:hypothetical protein
MHFNNHWDVASFNKMTRVLMTNNQWSMFTIAKNQCIKNQIVKISRKVKSWWEKSQHTKTLVTYKGFDKLMMLVKDKFNLQEPNFNSFVGKLERLNLNGFFVSVNSLLILS